jgi:hypothetical protein
VAVRRRCGGDGGLGPGYGLFDGLVPQTCARGCGLQIARNPLIHSRLFLVQLGNYLNDFNVDVGLLISVSKVRALVRPPSKLLK